MKIITKWEHIKQLEGVITDALREEIKHYYRGIALEMGEEAVEAFDMVGIGIIAILEAGDDISNLPSIGMTIQTITLLEAIPEFIDEINLVGEIWYRVTVILSADVGRVIYIPKSLFTEELETWIDTWKEA